MDRNFGVAIVVTSCVVALRKESVDRNVVSAFDVLAVSASLSARRAWIEIGDTWARGSRVTVALRKESVDRNTQRRDFKRLGLLVALRKESVDRNYKERPGQTARPKSLSARRAWIEIAAIRRAVLSYYVALRKESVDRNVSNLNMSCSVAKSLSARRAWIEIPRARIQYCSQPSLSARRAWIEIRRAMGFVDPDKVALRKESVDRNIVLAKQLYRPPPSLSARRAWIEIIGRIDNTRRHRVALRKESVDRNTDFQLWSPPLQRRSPQGERG